MTLEICQDCKCSVAFGSGRFINRVPADNWLCAECCELECDRCNKPIPLDEDFYLESKDLRLHEECMTKEERENKCFM